MRQASEAVTEQESGSSDVLPYLVSAAAATVAAGLIVAGALLWERHGMTIFLDRLATAVWNCF